jgi:anhydro-N-acetylmuramic acid kinase
MNQNYYSLGLMSGTSMDGVDASIIKSDGELSLKIIDEMYFEYEDKLKLELKEIVKQATSKKMIRKFKSRIKDLEENITKFHAHISNFIIKKNKGIKIDIVGFHGQTILHKPKEGYSIQIGNPRLLSKLIKKKVVFNFREKDIINGGQGAPLSPLYHRLLIHKIKLNYPSAIINIGGISNITYFNDIDDLCSFDLGPGNCLIDQWIYKHTEKNFDKNGLIAKQGNIDEKILKKLLKNIYYKKNIPKSLD